NRRLGGDARGRARLCDNGGVAVCLERRPGRGGWSSVATRAPKPVPGERERGFPAHPSQHSINSNSISVSMAWAHIGYARPNALLTLLPFEIYLRMNVHSILLRGTIHASGQRAA